MGLFTPATLDIDIDVDLERTDDSFHAYAIPAGVEIRPGDSMVIHNMPTRLQYGENRCFRTRATLTRAGAVRRLWTELAGLFELTTLYEVGFQPAEELVLHPRMSP
jgi:hypothetical protein